MPHIQTVSATQLRDMMTSQPGLTVIDVLPPEHFQARHIPGAHNVCVYEMVFLDAMRERFPDKQTPLVLSSASHRCQGAQDAAEKLQEAGYARLHICQDGLEGWERAGFPVEGQLGPEPASPDRLDVTARSLQVDPAASRVEWTGRNRNGRHLGTVPVKDGELRFSDGRLAWARCELDMLGLVNEDLADASLAALLVAHLASRDFFLTASHPEAVFETTSIQPVAPSSPGAPNYEVEGLLSLRGKTADLRFPLTAERLDDGRLALEAHFDLDRTRWGAVYGSGRFFEKLGMHLVHDLVGIQFRLVTLPA